MTKNADFDIFGIRFDAHRSFFLSGGSGFGKIIILFAADMSSSVDIHNKKSYLDSW